MGKPRARREQILDCAAALFARHGVAATTVRQIADEVGILSGSLYHHFASKEAMVEGILGPYLDELRDRYRVALADATDPATQLRRVIRASLETAAAHPHATEIYQNEVGYLRGSGRFPRLTGTAAEVQATWLAVIESGMRGGVFRADLDPGVCYRLVRQAVWLSVRWFQPSRDYPADRLADDCAELFLRGLTRPRRAAPAGPRSRSAARSS